MGKQYFGLQIRAFKLLRGVCQAPCINRISRIKQACPHHVTPVTSILCSGELGHRVLCLPTREHPDTQINRAGFTTPVLVAGLTSLSHFLASLPCLYM